MVRVLYDDSLASNPAGTGTFVRGLRSALQRRSDLTLVVRTSTLASAAQLNVSGKRASGRLASAARHLRYYLLDLPATARREHCDAVFCPTSLGPLRGRTPSFITLFDLSPLNYSRTLDRISGVYLRAMLLAGVRRARGICTISHAVATEIQQRFPRLDAIAVAYPGPNPSLIEAPPERVDLPPVPFLLMVGTLEPKKNHVTVLRALAEHFRHRPSSAVQLVLAGSAGWHYGPVLRTIDDLGLGSCVVRLGDVTPAQLRWLYERAQALLFPSLYEGFGLPVLEAFTLGCPVIAARIPSVMEITADTGAIMLDPLDVPGWADAIDRVESRTIPRQAMVDAGRRRAQSFTWAECAASVARLIGSA